MKPRTMEALDHAEAYFVAVLEQEADGTIKPSRTNELMEATNALCSISKIKYKQWLKYEIHKDEPISKTNHPEVSNILRNR